MSSRVLIKLCVCVGVCRPSASIIMARAVLVLVLWLLLLHFIAFIFPSCVSYNYGPARNQLKLLLHFCCNFFHSLVVLVADVLKSDFTLLFPLSMNSNWLWL